MTNALTALTLAAAGTYVLRVLATNASRWRPLTARAEHAMGHAALATLATMTTATLPHDGGVTTLPVVAAMTITALTARRVTSPAIPVAVGVGGFSLAQLLVA